MVPPATGLPLSPSSSLTVPILCPQTQPQPTAEPRPQSRRLSRWLHRLQEAEKVSLSGQGTGGCSAWELSGPAAPEPALSFQETPGCLEASVTLNLFRLLTLDLKCVASGHQCV